jgi:hypothetical protein
MIGHIYDREGPIPAPTVRERSIDSTADREGFVYVPTEWAGSPWSERYQHGGPVNALFAMAAEEASAEADLRVVRLTVDLFRPVPREPLALHWRFVRQGRRIANLEAELTRPEDGERISRASAVLLRPSRDLVPSWEHSPAPAPLLDAAEPVEFMPKAIRETFPPGFHRSFEVRMGADEHGPAAWITTPLSLLPDRPMSSLQRCAAVADLTFGLSGRSLLRQRIVDVDAWRVPMINTDTTIYWERPPVGTWFGFRHALLTDYEGIGLAEVDLADTNGRLGRSLQAMLANPPQSG